MATWNARQLGKDGASTTPAAEVIATLDADLIALQEVAHPSALQGLVDQVPGYEALQPTFDEGRGVLHQAFLWRSATVELLEPEVLTSGTPDTFPRPPLKVTVRSRERQGVDFTVFAVHLKAGVQAEDEQHRIDALAFLEARMRASVEADGGETELLLLGDFNEALSDPRANEAFAPFNDRPELYRFLTRGLAESGAVTFLPAKLMLDHMIATAALDDERTGALPEVMSSLSEENPSFATEVSDHLPVILDLQLGTAQAAD